MLELLANPWTILGLVVMLALSHGGAYIKGRSDGAAHERVVCEERVTVLKNQIIAANEAIRKIGEQWQKAFDTIVEGNTALAERDAKQVDDLTKQVEAYEQKIREAGGEQCLLTPDDINGMR